MNIAIYGRPVSEAQIPFAHTVLKTVKERGHKLLIHEKYLGFLKHNDADLSVFTTHEELEGKADFLFSIGGDGTLLDTILLVKDSMIPIVGINAGRLGFLSSVSKETLSSAMDHLMNGRFSLDFRSLLRLEANHPLFENENIALNDFTIHKKETASMITIHTYLNGESLNSYWADGLIVATPTGSTGYSLSCGGPIIVPESESFVITPIAPHNLNVRPIVVSDKITIKLTVEGRGLSFSQLENPATAFMATLDSRSTTIDPSFELTLKKRILWDQPGSYVGGETGRKR